MSIHLWCGYAAGNEGVIAIDLQVERDTADESLLSIAAGVEIAKPVIRLSTVVRPVTRAILSTYPRAIGISFACVPANSVYKFEPRVVIGNQIRKRRELLIPFGLRCFQIGFDPSIDLDQCIPGLHG